MIGSATIPASTKPNYRVIVSIAAAIVVLTAAGAAAYSYWRFEFANPLGAGVIYTPKATPSVPDPATAYKNGPLPPGRQGYAISGAGIGYPRFTKAVIDPLDSHPGQVQTLAALVEATSDVQEVTVRMETDDGYVTIPLHKTTSTDLVITATGTAPITPPPPPEGITRSVWEGQWTVRDTHSATYDARFEAKSANGATGQVTLSWRDPCTPPVQGSWTLDGNCGFTAVDGVVPDLATGNGDLTINSSSLTMTLNSTFVIYPGHKVTITAGQIAIGTGGSITFSRLWLEDQDNDGWGVLRVAQLNAPTATSTQNGVPIYYDQSDYQLVSTNVTKTATNGASMASGGTSAWNNPTKITASDNSYATSSVSQTNTKYLESCSFGFSIPTNATILGIKANIERSATGTPVTDDTTFGVRLLKAGALVGNVKTSSTAWSTSGDRVDSYGGSSDLWGTTLTPSDVNNSALCSGSAFGYAVAATSSVKNNIAKVDAMTMTVYYQYGSYQITHIGDCDDTNSSLTNNCATTPVCSPSSQSVGTGQAATLNATGGNGTYSWTATGGTPSSGSGSGFTVSYSTTGAKTVTLTSNSTSTSCTVNVGSTSTLMCIPTTQIMTVGQSGTFTASGGDGTYSWGSAGNPGTGSDSSYIVSFGSTGNYTISLTSNGSTVHCIADVNPVGGGETGTRAYCDADGDGHYTETQQVCGTGVATSSSAGNDCDDTDASTYTGQTGWFTSARSDGSFDYDCSGADDQEYPTRSKACLSGLGGWEQTVPTCGSSGVFETCGWDSINGWHIQSTSTLTQACH